jgi:hypothetical protein
MPPGPSVGVEGQVPMSPGSRHLGVVLVYETASADCVLARPGGSGQDRREPLNPAVQGHVVDRDAYRSDSSSSRSL